MRRLFNIAFYLGAVILSLLTVIAQAQNCPIPCDRYETTYEGQTCGIDPANNSTLIFSVKLCPCDADVIDLSVSGVLKDGTGFSNADSFSLPDSEVVVTRFQGFPVQWNDVATSSIVYFTISKQFQSQTIVSFTHSPMTSKFFVDATATISTTLETVTATETVVSTTTTTTAIPQQTATSQCTTGTITSTVSTSTSTSTSTTTPSTKTVTATKCKTTTTTISCIPPKHNGPRNARPKLHRRQLQGEEFAFCAPTDGLTPVPTFYTTGTTTVTVTLSPTVTDTVTFTSTTTFSETPVPATTTICNNVKATSKVTATTTTTITTTLKRRTLTKTYTKTSTETKFYGGKPKRCPTPYKAKGKGGRA